MHIEIMPIGSSGRIVVEVEPELKRALHRALRLQGTNLKEWFVDQARTLLAAQEQQLEMPFAQPELQRREDTR